jgi:hypothetical protein
MVERHRGAEVKNVSGIEIPCVLPPAPTLNSCKPDERPTLTEPIGLKRKVILFSI